ncbi:hypothetical protein [Spirosoma foliorum]|uniref:Uncharacterized protein n=1 Tax=Spirosoma foliorum TaxID=2710596 RepID=A0A7G5GTU7_9BACT|nr:hypothetical protein [Spirosoma foliorum]QMW02289.1 hypothetical protein H3H32_30930 [Spirosoma foliorum]
MTTGQNYVGGDSHATPNEQVVNSDPQTANTGGEVATRTASTLIPLPKYFDQATDSWDNLTRFRLYLSEVFIGYVTSPDYLFKNKDEKKTMRAYALNGAIANLVERAAEQKLGPRLTPIESYADVEKNLEGSIYNQPEASPIFMDSPLSCMDIEKLQQWVVTLQDLGSIQSKTIDRLSGVVVEQEGKLEEKNDRLESKSLIIQRQAEQSTRDTQQIEQLKAELAQAKIANTPPKPVIENKAPKPESSHTIGLHLSINGIGYSSEAEVVRRALIEYRDERLKQAMRDVARDQADEAYNEFKDYQIIQQVLDEIAEGFAELAEENSRAASYAEGPKHYSLWFNSIKEREIQDRREFVEKYSSPYEEEEEQEEGEEDVAPTVDLEPEYLQGLSEVDKQIISGLKDKGLKEGGLILIADGFRKSALSGPATLDEAIAKINQSVSPADKDQSQTQSSTPGDEKAADTPNA